MAIETRGTISNARNPSLWRRNGVFYCMVQHRGTDEIHLYKSTDFARAWEQITVATIWDSSTYYRASGCGLSDGRHVSIAATRGSDPLELSFRLSNDGVTWGAIVPIGTYDGDAKQFVIRQRVESGRIDLVVTNSVDAAWISYDLGRTWQAY